MSSNPPVKSPYLTVAEVSAHLRLDSSTIRRWISVGKLAAIRVGGHRLIRPEDIEPLVSDKIAIQAPTPRTVSEQARRAQSETMKRWWANPEYAAKINRPKYLDPKKRRQIIELLQQQNLGSFSAVATVAGVSSGTVAKIAKQAGVEISAPNKLSAFMKRRWSDPELRAQMTANKRRTASRAIPGRTS